MTIWHLVTEFTASVCVAGNLGLETKDLKTLRIFYLAQNRPTGGDYAQQYARSLSGTVRAGRCGSGGKKKRDFIFCLLNSC